MPRAVDGTRRKDRRKKLLAFAKGYWGRRKNLFRTAKDAVAKSLVYAYRDRKDKKGTFRSLWISRISAGVRAENLTYSRFIEGLRKANITINRKVISNMAIDDHESFVALVKEAKKALGA
jgi:large subunit ribosomal protein L20